MKIFVWIILGFISIPSAGWADTVRLAADAPFGMESDVAEQSKPHFIMPQPLSELIAPASEFKVSLTRDPFTPLVMPELEVQRVITPEEEILNKMEYTGVIKWGDRFSALIKIENIKEVYQVNDQVLNLTIIGIDEEKITFQMENKTYQLQRGDK